jgi:hypothetical protein
MCQSNPSSCLPVFYLLTQGNECMLDSLSQAHDIGQKLCTSDRQHEFGTITLVFHEK